MRKKKRGGRPPMLQNVRTPRISSAPASLDLPHQCAAHVAHRQHTYAATPKYYKLGHKTILEKYVCNGELQLGSLQYYRLLEILTGDFWTGDINDGQAHTCFDEVKHNDAHTHETLSKVGIKVSMQDETSKLTGLRFIQVVDGYAFCCAYSDLQSLQSEMKGNIDYNGAVEILDIRNLVERIKKAIFRGRPLSETFTIEDKLINYNGEKLYDGVAAQQVKSADGFTKTPDYRCQKEFRIFLKPLVSGDLDDFIKLTIDPTGLFGEVEDVDFGKQPLEHPQIECSSENLKKQGHALLLQVSTTQHELEAKYTTEGKNWVGNDEFKRELNALWRDTSQKFITLYYHNRSKFKDRSVEKQLTHENSPRNIISAMRGWNSLR